MWWLNLPVVVMLLAMAWQDWKERAIAVWLFVLTGVAMLVLKYLAVGMPTLLEDFKLNLLFLVLQMVLLFGYFALREGRFVNLLKGYLGEGDLLFLFLLCTYLSFVNFLIFHVLSLLLMLVLGLYLRKQTPKMPLAGGQAFLLALLMLVEGFWKPFKLTQDFWTSSFYPY